MNLGYLKQEIIKMSVMLLFALLWIHSWLFSC